jgi:hypothetical protein
MNLLYAFSEFSDAGGDFRGAFWGMTKEEVKRSEGLLPLSEGEGYVTYGERVMGLDSVVGYHFRDGALVEAGYAFREPLGGGHVYISEYSKVKGLLTGSYGEPALDEGEYGECGAFCVRCSGGECSDACPLIYLSEWMTGRSVIRLVLMGGESGYDFGLLHRSREHEMLIGRGEG